MKRLVTYLVVTFGLTWCVLIGAGLALGTFVSGEESSVPMLVLMVIAMFFPLIGALVANLVCRPEERIDLGIRPHIRGNLRHYLAAWFAPSALALLGFAAFFATNPQLFDPTMASYLQTMATQAGVTANELLARMPPVPVMAVGSLATAITIAPFINMIPAVGEEIGWRSMLFATLAERMSQRSAALTSGIIWGLWHAPGIAMGHNFGMGYAGFPFVGILVMTLTCTAMGCWLALLRMRTQSVWPCALAHGAFNAVANLGVPFCACGRTPLGPSPLGLVAGIPLIVLGIVCLLRLPMGNDKTAEHAR